MMDWIRTFGDAVWWGVGVSLLTLAVALAAVPLLVVRAPADYFAGGDRATSRGAGLPPVARALLLVGKNVLGCLLIAAGVAMLVLPGQGVLTILAGTMLVDFPGKRRLERWIVERGPVLRAMNWLRERAGREPFAVVRR